MNNEQTVSSLVAMFPETKSEIESFVSKMVKNALDGYVNPLHTEAQLACMEKVVKDIRSNPEFKEAVLKEAEKFGQKNVNEHNAQFQIKEVGAKWHYENCNHQQYERICQQIDEITKQKKAFEKFIQAQKKPYEHVDTETGEMYEVNPPYKTSTTSVVVTISK